MVRCGPAIYRNRAQRFSGRWKSYRSVLSLWPVFHVLIGLVTCGEKCCGVCVWLFRGALQGKNDLDQRPRICILRSTRGVAISVQLENRVKFAPTVAPDPLAAWFLHRTFLFGAKLAIMSGPWTSPLLDTALASLAISWSSSTCTRTGRRRVAALG